MYVSGIRRWWLIPAGLVLGVLVGIVVSLASSTPRKAEASVLISSPGGVSAVTPFLPNLRELATSGVLAGNVRSTLRLKESVAELHDHLDAEVRARSQVIVIAATDTDEDKARQIAQEAAGVFTQLVQSRFGRRSPPLQAALFDSAIVLSKGSRHFLRNALIGGLVGLLLGVAAAALLLDRAQGVAAGPSPAASANLRRREKSLQQRIDQVTARERELARRAGQLAALQRELDERDRAKPEPVAEPPSPPPGEQPAPPLPTPREPAPTAPVASADGRWNLSELERLVEANSDASPEQAQEWRTYVFFLRGHAAMDGSLPAQFDDLINDVFGDLLS